MNGRLCRTIGLQESRAVAQKPRDAVVNFFIEIYSGIARPPCDSTALVYALTQGLMQNHDKKIYILTRFSSKREVCKRKAAIEMEDSFV